MQSIQCLQCVHFEGGTICRAYLQGIPDIIWDGTHDHRQPYKGDNGIVFQPITATKATDEPDASEDARQGAA